MSLLLHIVPEGTPGRKSMEVSSPEIGIATKETTLIATTEPTSYTICALTYVHTKTAEIRISCTTPARTGFNTRIPRIEGYCVAQSTQIKPFPNSRNIKSTYAMDM